VVSTAPAALPKVTVEAIFFPDYSFFLIRLYTVRKNQSSHLLIRSDYYWKRK